MRLLVALAGLLALVAAALPAAARGVEIHVETAMASRLLDLACSSRPVDRAEWIASPLLRDQLAHHGRFGPQFSLDNYVAGVEAIARCQAPKPDPFRFTALVERREEMERAIGFLVSRREDLGKSAAALLLPFVPRDMDFKGSVVLAAASFSCGGFAHGGSFFIDIPCIASDIEGEYEAVTKLVAHETYHAIQSGFMPKPAVGFGDVSRPHEGLEHLLTSLATEGSASFVADMRTVEGDGRYAKFSREIARRNYGHLEHDFRLLGYVAELLAKPDKDYRRRFEELYTLAFGGAFDEHGYYVGQQMSAEIVSDFGPSALPCVLALPPENFVLAYDRALATGSRLKDSYPLPEAMLGAARALAGARAPAVRLNRCLEHR